jgi:hypothetical protein
VTWSNEESLGYFYTYPVDTPFTSTTPLALTGLFSLRVALIQIVFIGTTKGGQQ